MLEYEKKLLLTKEEYECIRHHGFFRNETQTQMNYYYDNDDYSLSESGKTCRIREKNGSFIATIKEHKNRTSDCSIENSIEVKNQYDDSLFSGMNVKLKGKLKTERITTDRFNGVKVMLDRNIYLDTVDYEMEIEYEPKNEAAAMEVIEKIINYLAFWGMLKDYLEFKERVYRTPNKSQRFFRQLQYINKKEVN